jgi:hypothetical protein
MSGIALPPLKRRPTFDNLLAPDAGGLFLGDE